MRIWTLHPRYLDSVGLVSVWRKALLARQVLRGKTKGYRNHPQLERFREHPSPLSAINAYLLAVHKEASARGYSFDRKKLGAVRTKARIRTTEGQLRYEWKHLRTKLEERCPERARRSGKLVAHPLFRVVPGPVEAWERQG
ncbi:MAG: pyrimidine dimer DNA glycosylase/endonuclease V [Planctomycetota bacterium]|jgi:hypothetical protein